jgi:hypothetical protein
MIDLSFTILGQTIPAGHGYSTHLAQLCRVTVGRLNAAVERNRLRFPPDFVFPLTAADWGDLKLRFQGPAGAAVVRYRTH